MFPCAAYTPYASNALTERNIYATAVAHRNGARWRSIPIHISKTEDLGVRNAIELGLGTGRMKSHPIRRYALTARARCATEKPVGADPSPRQLQHPTYGGYANEEPHDAQRRAQRVERSELRGRELIFRNVTL